MGLDISVEIDIDVPKHLSAIEDDRIGVFAASEWHRLYEDYVPKDSGMLYESGFHGISPWMIEHRTPYAEEVYTHNRNYKKDKHTKATARWSEAAEPAEKPKLIQSIQNYLKRGDVDL